MIQRVNEKRLTQLVRELAQKISREIMQAGVKANDFEGIVRLNRAVIRWQEMELAKLGYYVKDECKIILNSQITNVERLNFTFYHELTHHLIEHNDEILSLFADAYIPTNTQDETMERLCNAGAAELLVPSDNVYKMVKEKEFSTALIPELCERYRASSIAVSLQMVNIAHHDCYLFIAELRSVSLDKALQPMLFPYDKVRQQQLYVIYSAGSPQSKYLMPRNIPIPYGHLMYETLKYEGEAIKGKDDIPRRNSINHAWITDCDAMYFRGKVFAFFNVSQPINNQQMLLL
ncbi:MAG: ImmA/IrrE family metallo-endopeptidase [Chloroflexi bacterium]|nr:ImmA/IrrE family metallo-endopeptidase [Chloroflexota bacterium]